MKYSYRVVILFLSVVMCVACENKPKTTTPDKKQPVPKTKPKQTKPQPRAESFWSRRQKATKKVSIQVNKLLSKQLVALETASKTTDRKAYETETLRLLLLALSQPIDVLALTHQSLLKHIKPAQVDVYYSYLVEYGLRLSKINDKHFQKKAKEIRKLILAHQKNKKDTQWPIYLKQVSQNKFRAYTPKISYEAARLFSLGLMPSRLIGQRNDGESFAKLISLLDQCNQKLKNMLSNRVRANDPCNKLKQSTDQGRAGASFDTAALIGSAKQGLLSQNCLASIKAEQTKHIVTAQKLEHFIQCHMASQGDSGPDSLVTYGVNKGFNSYFKKNGKEEKKSFKDENEMLKFCDGIGGCEVLQRVTEHVADGDEHYYSYKQTKTEDAKTITDITVEKTMVTDENGFLVSKTETETTIVKPNDPKNKVAEKTEVTTVEKYDSDTGGLISKTKTTTKSKYQYNSDGSKLISYQETKTEKVQYDKYGNEKGKTKRVEKFECTGTPETGSSCKKTVTTTTTDENGKSTTKTEESATVRPNPLEENTACAPILYDQETGGSLDPWIIPDPEAPPTGPLSDCVPVSYNDKTKDCASVVLCTPDQTVDDNCKCVSLNANTNIKSVLYKNQCSLITCLDGACDPSTGLCQSAGGGFSPPLKITIRTNKAPLPRTR